MRALRLAGWSTKVLVLCPTRLTRSGSTLSLILGDGLIVGESGDGLIVGESISTYALIFSLE